VDDTLANLHEITPPAKVGAGSNGNVQHPDAPEFVREVIFPMIEGRGDALPVSCFPADGTYPTATTRYEKRNIALEVPEWDPDICIQCGKCVMVCPHSVIRSKLLDDKEVAGAPEGFLHTKGKWRGLENEYTIQVSVEDCTGCRLCVEICPAKDKTNVAHKALNMIPRQAVPDEALAHWDYFAALPDSFRALGGEDVFSFSKVKDVQLTRPLFEFSSACAGCGETPYLKLLTQLFGDRALIANATGCSSIYGGNMPTTPYAQNDDGRGPAWNNSLFEDNAEFGFGFRMAYDKKLEYARELVEQLRDVIGDELAGEILSSEQRSEGEINLQRKRVEALKDKLEGRSDGPSVDLLGLADMLVRKSVWIVGGDGWAYDIGFGGLDHVLASGRNVNVLVLDTEVYSNTGGQASKATPMGAVAKFAAAGKPTPKKDLGKIAMDYGHVYVAQVAMGASDSHTLKAFLEAESYDGPSLIIAYSHCIAHGIDMTQGMSQQKLATDAGHWPLYRYDPRVALEGKNPLQLDSKPPKIPMKEYMYNENRYRMLTQSKPEVAEHLLEAAQANVNARWEHLRQFLASVEPTSEEK
jgi:pyruvate-ferredoxin/flavodoxin oxidoreductase